MNKRVVLVALGGPSSSGKTTCSIVLHSLFPHSKLVHQDDFYLDDDKIPLNSSGEQNWDCPEAIDFTRFKRYLNDLKHGTPTADIKTLEPDSKLKLSNIERSKLQQEVTDAKVTNDTLIVFIDGFMLFHDQELIKQFDLSLFYYASFETLKERREARSGYVTTQGFWVDPPNYFRDIVWPAFESNHKYLFVHGEVGGELNSSLLTKYNIKPYKNEKGTSLYKLVSWSLERILECIRV